MPDGEWQAYGRTEHGDRYSPLRQITPQNAYRLEEAWRIRTGDLPTDDDPVELTNQNTPLKVNGMLYACTAHSKLLALDPDTGAEIWRFDPQIKSPTGSLKGFAHMTCRGVSYYDENRYVSRDGKPAPKISDAGQIVAQTCPRRLYLPTADARLIAINADNGKVCEGFANQGVIDLTTGLGPFTAGGYYSTSPAAVTRELVIIGGHVTDNESTNEPSGVIRAYDVHDGHLVWNWDSNNPEDTKPLAAGQTYSRNSANMWSIASVDEDLGMIYLPLGNQTPTSGRRPYPRRREVQRRYRRPGPGHRQSALELPVHPPRPVGYGRGQPADPGAPENRRWHQARGHRADQARQPVCARPSRRHADRADP